MERDPALGIHIIGECPAFIAEIFPVCQKYLFLKGLAVNGVLIIKQPVLIYNIGAFVGNVVQLGYNNPVIFGIIYPM